MAKDILTIGYAVTDNIHGEEHFGGSAAIVAINGRNLGLETGILTVFGTDARSKQYWDYLSQIGVDLTLSSRMDDISIPSNTISHEDRTRGWQDNGALEALSAKTVSQEQLNAYEVIHLASAPPGLVEKIAKTPTDALISYSPGPKVAASDAYINTNMLNRSTVVFLNQAEWVAAQRILNLSTAEELLQYGPEVLVLTNGKQGTTIYQKSAGEMQSITIPATSVANAETTGAGDAFALGFLIAYTRGENIEKAGKVGRMLASYSLEQTGGILPPEKVTQARNLRRGGIEQ